MAQLLRVVILKPSKYTADGYVERFRPAQCSGMSRTQERIPQPQKEIPMKWQSASGMPVTSKCESRLRVYCPESGEEGWADVLTWVDRRPVFGKTVYQEHPQYDVCGCHSGPDRPATIDPDAVVG